MDAPHAGLNMSMRIVDIEGGADTDTKMDRDEGTALPSATFLSLTGYLDLYQKTWRGRQKKRYWFWFDEQTCHLKYYRNQEAYQHGVFEPLMTIDLRYAAVTPPMAGEELLANQFQINTGGQTYILAATDAKKAHSWIKKLQEKREQWIRRESAQGKTDLSRQAKKKTLQPLHERPGVLLPDEGSEGQDKQQSSTVRKIMQRHMKLENRHSSPLESAGCYPLDVVRSNTAVSETYAGTDDATFLESPERREILEFRHAYHASQEEVTRLQKEVLLLKDRMEKKNEKIVQLNSDIDDLSESLAKIKSGKSPDNYELEIESLRDIIEQYKRSVQSLVNEVELKRLQEEEYERKVNVERVKVQELEREVNKFKAKFVTLLSDKFKVIVPNPAGAEEERKGDEDETMYQEELLQLLQKESDGNDMFHYKSSFKDEYGDWHNWHSDSTVQHYLCRQLYLHYTQHESEMLVQEWTDFLKPIKHVKGRTYLDLLPGNERIKGREVRNLLRRGVPIQFRTRIWSSLVYRLVGKVKEVKDNTAGADNTYYTSLLNTKTDSTAEKQILLDLHRTLPSNAHFRSKGYGAEKLKNVLLAYSRHNKNIGYCQGMNLIAAIGLLFLDEETTFWFLYVVIEKLLPLDYFSPGLLGAQADQAVLRELLPQKLPRLSGHLDLHSIDVTLITFNWFLTLFIDAMPTESALRILDCFLLEGPKVLFRVGLGVLKVNARHLLSITDPVALFQTLKEIAKHTFDIDQLLKVAFTGMEPFPPRNVLTGRHNHHYSKIKDQWLLREKELKEREVRSKLEKLHKKPPLLSRVLERSFRETQKSRRHLMWECGCVRNKADKQEVWLCCGDRHQGRVAVISTSNEKWHTKAPNYDVSSRVISVGYVKSDLLVLGTLDFNIYAFHCQSERKVWSMKMPDSVLAIQSTDDCTVFAALADGFVAVLQNVDVEPPERGPLLVHIGSGAVTCLSLYLDQQQLWCGCRNAITILSLQNFEPIHSIAMEELKVYKMATSDYGVWVSFRSSSIVSLYEARRHVKLLQVDYTSVLPSSMPSSDELDSRITSMMVAGNQLWLGSGKGEVLIFAISEAVSEAETTIAELEQSSIEATAGSVALGAVGHGLLTPDLPIHSDDTSSVNEKNKTSHYRNRRTAFGRTLRGPSTKLVPKRTPSVFQLQFKCSRQISHAESVRVLLSLDQGPAVVSCIHSVTDWDKGVQGWTRKTTPYEWNFEYLPLSLENEQDAAAQLENETLGSEEGDEQKDSGESETHDTFVL